MLIRFCFVANLSSGATVKFPINWHLLVRFLTLGPLSLNTSISVHIILCCSFKYLAGDIKLFKGINRIHEWEIEMLTFDWGLWILSAHCGMTTVKSGQPAEKSSTIPYLTDRFVLGGRSWDGCEASVSKITQKCSLESQKAEKETLFFLHSWDGLSF